MSVLVIRLWNGIRACVHLYSLSDTTPVQTTDNMNSTFDSPNGTFREEFICNFQLLRPVTDGG